MTQQQIKGATGTVDGSGSLQTYEVAGDAIVTPFSVSVKADGTGASGAFLPCLTFRTITGAVIARCPAPEVAAGDTAEVSWFPGVGSSGSSGAGAVAETAYLWGVNAAPLAVPSGSDTHYIPWQHFQTTDSGTFGTDTTGAASPPYHNTAGDKYVYLIRDGAYLCVGQVHWEAGAYSQGMIIDNPGGQWELNELAEAVTTTEDLATNVSPGDFVNDYGASSIRMFYVDSGTGAGVLRMLPVQTSGGSKNVTDATMGIYYLGGTTADLGMVY